MLRLQAFQYELVPNRQQAQQMRQFAGARRFAINEAWRESGSLPRIWKKAKARITNARRDFLHKVTTNISKNHAVIVIEDLKGRRHEQVCKGHDQASW